MWFKNIEELKQVCQIARSKISKITFTSIPDLLCELTRIEIDNKLALTLIGMNQYQLGLTFRESDFNIVVSQLKRASTRVTLTIYDVSSKRGVLTINIYNEKITSLIHDGSDVGKVKDLLNVLVDSFTPTESLTPRTKRKREDEAALAPVQSLPALPLSYPSFSMGLDFSLLEGSVPLATALDSVPVPARPSKIQKTSLVKPTAQGASKSNLLSLSELENIIKQCHSLSYNERIQAVFGQYAIATPCKKTAGKDEKVWGMLRKTHYTLWKQTRIAS